jgi:sialidase-1
MDNYRAATGLIYRNLLPHVSSQHAYFPSVVMMDNGEMLSSVVIGEAFEAVNLDSYILRSKDQGETWSSPIPLLPAKYKHLCSNVARLTSIKAGEIVAIVVLSHREAHPKEGLANPDNIGFVPTELLLVRSSDYGNTWHEPEPISSPLKQPLEACSSIMTLKDGTWIWPTSIWRNWDGSSPDGIKMVALFSHDQGKTWPDHVDVMNGTRSNIIYWESKIIERANGTLLAVAWAYDEGEGKDLPNQYTWSHDGGKTWTDPVSTGLSGQTMALTELPDGRLLIIYRRMDKVGLWATISSLETGNWINEREFPLWGAQQEGSLNKPGNMVHDFNELKFGAPCITTLSDNSFFIAFWCYEKMVSNIRWFKLKV